MKVYFLVIAIILGVTLGCNFKKKSNELTNGKCYALLKASYKSDFGIESFDGVITFYFLKNKGSIFINAQLTTIDNVKIPLSQRMNIVFSPSKNGDYTLKVVSLMNKSLEDQTQEKISPHMRNMIDTHLINPSNLNIRLTPDKNNGYLIYNNIIPWVYCNNIR